MSKIMTFAAALAACAAIAVPANSATWDKDYTEVMIAAAVEGDYEAGETAAQDRNEKIERYGLEFPEVDFNDLYLLSKIMYAEAGSVWLSDEWKMCVGEVVLNRVASPEFADTIQEVLEQPGQYYGKGCDYFEELRPSECCVRLALRLLEGERVLNDPSVVFQANFKQGGGIHAKLQDEQLGASYFCYSIRPWLYDLENAQAASPIPELAPDAPIRYNTESLKLAEKPMEGIPYDELKDYISSLRRAG